MNNHRLTLAVSLFSTLLICLCASAYATVIDFEDRSGGVQGVATLSYPEADFTSSTGDVYVGGAGVSKDFCAYDGSCAGVLTVEFTSPVNNLTFGTAGEQTSGILSFADVYVNGIFDSVVNISYDGVFGTYDFVDLSSFSNVTRLVLSSIDGAGVTWDNFSFDSSSPTIPEPSTLALLGIGITGLIAFARRRTRS